MEWCGGGGHYGGIENLVDSQGWIQVDSFITKDTLLLIFSLSLSLVTRTPEWATIEGKEKNSEENKNEFESKG